MPAPSAENAWERAIQIIVISSIIVLLAVTIILSVYGSIVAGLVLNMASLLVLVGVAGGAIYWNTEYTAIIAIGGTLLFFFTPGILSRLVHPALAAVNSLLVLGFLGYIWLLLAGKLGLDVPSW